MSNTFETFIFVILSLFACIGIVFFFEQLYLLIFYKKKFDSNFLIVSLKDKSPLEINDVFYEITRALYDKRINSVINKIYIIDFNSLNIDTIREINFYFHDKVEFIFNDELTNILKDKNHVGANSV